MNKNCLERGSFMIFAFPRPKNKAARLSRTNNNNSGIARRTKCDKKEKAMKKKRTLGGETTQNSTPF
jgi:hypothetical protein